MCPVLLNTTSPKKINAVVILTLTDKALANSVY